MNNPGPSHMMIAIGFPTAKPNHLDRKESNSNGRSQDNGDIAEEAITSVVECLHHKGPAAVGMVKLFGKAMLRMAEAAQDGDDRALQLAAGAAHKALLGLIE
jgi:hypothetical protein